MDGILALIAAYWIVPFSLAALVVLAVIADRKQGTEDPQVTPPVDRPMVDQH